MQLPRTSVKIPTGLSFDVPDLLIARAWSEFHDLRMAIDLDVCAEGDEYEELLGIYESTCAFRRWMIWRSCDGIMVQPAMGRTLRFDSMSEALDILLPARDTSGENDVPAPNHRQPRA